METRIGSGCLFMVSSHVAHDCRLGDSRHPRQRRRARRATCTVEDYAIVGGLAGVHQFVRLGESALCAAGAMVSKDVPPFCTAAGDRARLLRPERRRAPPPRLLARRRSARCKRAYRLALPRRRQRGASASRRSRAELGDVPEVERLLAFVAGLAARRRAGERPMERIGLIAGSGRFPVLFAETARRRGVEVVAVAHAARPTRSSSGVVEAITWVHAGRARGIIAGAQAGGRDAGRHGGRHRQAAPLPRAPARRARARASSRACGTLRDDVAAAGARARSSRARASRSSSRRSTCRRSCPAAGVLGRARARRPRSGRDIHFGFRAAKVIGQFDIGQSVVVRERRGRRRRGHRGHRRDDPARRPARERRHRGGEGVQADAGPALRPAGGRAGDDPDARRGARPRARHRGRTHDHPRSGRDARARRRGRHRRGRGRTAREGWR